MGQVDQADQVGGGGTNRGREVGGWEVEINRSLENDNNVNVLLLFSFSILGI